MSRVPLDIIAERLLHFDPNEVVEMLQITSEDLVNAFKTRIKKYQDKLASELDGDIEKAFSHEDDKTFDNYDADYHEDFLEEQNDN